MGTPMSKIEKWVDIYFLQTLEMNIPMEEAETAVTLYYMFWGSTCILSKIDICLTS